MNEFNYMPIHNTDEFEVNFTPSRKYSHDRNARRFAVCKHEKDARIICQAMNEYTERGGNWV